MLMIFSFMDSFEILFFIFVGKDMGLWTSDYGLHVKMNDKLMMINDVKQPWFWKTLT